MFPVERMFLPNTKLFWVPAMAAERPKLAGATAATTPPVPTASGAPSRRVGGLGGRRPTQHSGPVRTTPLVNPGQDITASPGVTPSCDCPQYPDLEAEERGTGCWAASVSGGNTEQDRELL